MISALICLLSFKNDLVEVIEGNLPIVITAPHGGTSPIPGSEERNDTSVPQFVTVVDTRTDSLARETAREIEKCFGKKPWVVIAKFSRKYADANRPAKYGAESEAAREQHKLYHDSIRKAVDSVRGKFGKGILLDFHGQAADKDVVYRGTQNLKSVGEVSDELLSGEKSFLGVLENLGVKIVPDAGHARDKEHPKFNGGFTVQTYGLGQADGIFAVQLEFGGSYRSTKAIPDTAKKIAAALKSHCDAFLISSR
jgi:N-formylglutamate amidohydrolase